VRLEFSDPDPCTNNTTEYEALLLGLRKMKALGHPNFVIKSDSKVITDHVEKESEAKKPEMKMYLDAVRAMEKYFKGFTAIHIPRSQNDEADKLAKAAARKDHYLWTFFTRKSQNLPQNKKKQNKSTS